MRLLEVVVLQILTGLVYLLFRLILNSTHKALCLKTSSPAFRWRKKPNQLVVVFSLCSFVY